MTTQAAIAAPRPIPPGSRLLTAHLSAARAEHQAVAANTNARPSFGGSRTLATAILDGANRPAPTAIVHERVALDYAAPKAVTSVLTKEERQALDAELATAKEQRILAARNTAAAFCEYVLRDEGSLQEITLARAQEELHEFCDQHTQVVVHAHVEFGKALAVDTPIPTPGGWTAMGDLRAGDTVFDSFGRPCTVTGATPVMHEHRVYRVTFDDGDSILADAEHRWIAKTLDDAVRQALDEQSSHNHEGDGAPCAVTGLDGWRVVTTEEMLAAGLTRVSGAKRKDGTRHDQHVWRMPLPEPVQYPERALPIHPYVLGAWLGGGTSSGDGLKARLQALGVLDHKHIPDTYLTASVEQRRDLLAGLLDTDDTSNTRGNVEFANTNQRLAEQVLELVRSLGFKATIVSTPARLRGRVIGTVYRVCFTPKVPVFRLRRKLDRQRFGTPTGRISYRSVVSIEPVPSVPVRCIAVDSPNHSYLAGRGYAVTHNSSLISVGRVLWELGKNPNLRIAIVSETDTKAKKLLRGIRRYLLNSRELREVFPHLVKSKNKDDPWNAHAITVQRESFARDPSIQVTGCGGSIIGARIDLLILDDILSHRTALTKSAQEKLLSWYASNCAGRMTEHGRIIAVGTPWARNDLYSTLAKTEGWVSKKFPVIDPATGLPTWPENWSLVRIAKARQRLGPIEAARQLDCEPSDESTNRFQDAWIKRSMENGDGDDAGFTLTWAELFPEGTPTYAQQLPPGYFTVTGVDVGASMRSTGGLTVLTTLLIYPNGERQILCIESGRWTGPQILQRCFETHARYRSTVFVEDNGAQKFLLDFAAVMNLPEIPPIRPHTTGRNKHDPTFGVESIATEMFQGRWTIPCTNGGAITHEEVAALLKEMRDYNPDDHMGDRLSSLWIANMGAHTLRTIPGTNEVRARAFAPMDDGKREFDL